jgi:hypothetical protein
MSKCIHGVSLRHSCDQCLNLNRPGVGSELYRLECERDTLRTANQRLEGEVAQLKAQSAPEPVSREAVQVVGVRISTDGFGSYIADSAMGIGGPAPGEVRESLMTVAQHQRILAASAHPADQVAEPDAELVELLIDARKGLDNVGRQDLYINYEGVSKIKGRIDAKLASLK